MSGTPKGNVRGRFVMVMLLSLALAGCATSTRNTTSAMDYLYPNSNTVDTPSVPILRLPLRVGIAFTPGDRPVSSSGTNRPKLFFRSSGQFVLTENKKHSLMQEVANHFKKYPFVKDIEIIPSAYLEPRGGFADLDKIKILYDVSVIVLISYDQTQFTDEGALSMAYWTIVGAYVVNGEKNDTHTTLDAVVYDISSRKMLFRAPGASLVKGNSTPVNLSEQQRADSESGFENAAREMVANLDVQLAAFREKIRALPKDYTIVRPDDYKGD